VRNIPSPEGAMLGVQLAVMVSIELEAMRHKYPNHREPCGTCAFSKGTVPNRCVATVMDALKCAIEQREFRCHETHEMCCGWLLMCGAQNQVTKNFLNLAGEGKHKAPWDWSVTDEDERKLTEKALII